MLDIMVPMLLKVVSIVVGVVVVVEVVGIMATMDTMDIVDIMDIMVDMDMVVMDMVVMDMVVMDLLSTMEPVVVISIKVITGMHMDFRLVKDYSKPEQVVIKEAINMLIQ